MRELVGVLIKVATVSRQFRTRLTETYDIPENHLKSFAFLPQQVFYRHLDLMGKSGQQYVFVTLDSRQRFQTLLSWSQRRRCS